MPAHLWKKIIDVRLPNRGYYANKMISDPHKRPRGRNRSFESSVLSKPVAPSWLLKKSRKVHLLHSKVRYKKANLDDVERSVNDDAS